MVGFTAAIPFKVPSHTGPVDAPGFLAPCMSYPAVASMTGLVELAIVQKPPATSLDWFL